MHRINPPFIFLEDRNTKSPYRGFLFRHFAHELVVTQAHEFYQAFQILRDWQKEGFFLVGFVSYEAGYLLQNLMIPSHRNIPLLHFVAYQEMVSIEKEPAEEMLLTEEVDFFIKNRHLRWSNEEYERAFFQVKHHLQQGDTYQVNLTSKCHFDFKGSPIGLYRVLRSRQEVAYSGLLLFSQYQILTLSPELFFLKNHNKLYTRPMKGTIQRGETFQADEDNKNWLLNDTKSKAENTMIVDLLRNDMARISTQGRVFVSSLLEIESYKTVHQMVSKIESEVDVDIDFLTLLEALFPCGSITGAPKRRTMEIIQTVEAEPRGLYTGAIGYILPNNDMCFSVAIRTLVIQNGRGELGLGGGIVYDSQVKEEYAELLLKGDFFTKACEQTT